GGAGAHPFVRRSARRSGLSERARRRLPRQTALAAALRSKWLSAAASSHEGEQAVPAHGPWPAPHFPGVSTVLDREEDDLRLADDVLVRHVADLAEPPAVGRVVAVVAHHEIVARRHGVDGGVVIEAVVGEIERSVGHAVRQGFAEALDPLHGALFAGHIVVDALALHRLAVDVEDS